MEPGKVKLTELAGQPALIPSLRELLAEYGQYMYDDLGLIAGKETFFKDLQQIPSPSYEPPQGTYLVAFVDSLVAGCAGIKKYNDNTCELKRMFIRPGFRSNGLGKTMVEYMVAWCRRNAYTQILLDTNAEMTSALHLYKKCGFVEIPPYCINENQHPVYMEFVL